MTAGTVGFPYKFTFFVYGEPAALIKIMYQDQFGPSNSGFYVGQAYTYYFSNFGLCFSFKID